MISDKTMFEIYREEGYGRKYRVVYFTELNDHNRETEISKAGTTVTSPSPTVSTV